LVPHPQYRDAVAAEIYAVGNETLMNETLLELNQVEVVYDHAVRAVQGISIRVLDGSTVGLIGLNGAGKTTSLRAISGFLPSENATITQGAIRFSGQDIAGWRPDQTASLGIVIVPEHDKVFKTLSVHENIEIGWRTRSPSGTGYSITLSNVYDAFPTLAAHQHRDAIWLSGGERQMLAIATSLIKRPKLLLVDEMSLGLSPWAMADVIAKLKALKAELGFSLLIVDQNARAVLEMADYGYIIENGMIVRDGEAQDLLANSEVQEFYLGLRQASGESTHPSYRDVKQYRRSRRWWG
jgi:branched-chain amino acid transport system ATP-binding protein